MAHLRTKLMPAFWTGGEFLFVEARLIVGGYRVEVGSDQQGFHILGIQTGQEVRCAGCVFQDGLQAGLVPNLKHICESEIAAKERQVVVVDGKGHRCRATLGVHAKNHGHRPLPRLQHADAAGRLDAVCLHALQGLGTAVAEDQAVELGVVLGRIPEAVLRDGVHQGIKVVQLWVGVPALCLVEGDVAKLQSILRAG